MQEAIKKLQAEMDSSKNNPYVKVIGEFLIKHIEANPASADKMLDADKTIAKSLEAMKNEAKKKQHNGMAMLTDTEGFAIVLKYFGVQDEPVPFKTEQHSPGPEKPNFDVKLDDFL